MPPVPADALPLLEVQDLRVHLPTARGPLAALGGVSLQLPRAGTLGLVGESGCGKSTLALALMGLLPDGARVDGSMRLAGRELATLDEGAWCRLRGDRLAMVFQEPMSALNPLHPIGRQVGEPLRVHRGWSAAQARAEALRLLDRVQLPQAARRLDAYPHQLSGGQRQRVVIAMALACGPALLIADEPTTALDNTVQREVLDLLATLVREDGMSMLLISHDLGVVARSVAQLAVMYAGHLVEQGPAAQLLNAPRHPYTRALFAARPRLRAHRVEGPGATPSTRPRLPAIPGRVPDLTALPPGCPYAERCPHAVPACRDAVPPMVPVASGQAARCIRLNDMA